MANTDRVLSLELTKPDPRSATLLKADPTTSSLVLQQPEGHVAYIHTPDKVTSNVPVLVVLHGAGKGKFWNVKQSVASWGSIARSYNMIVIYPVARGSTWDYIASKRTQRRDIDFIQFSLNTVRGAFPVDDRRIAVCGLSDGGSMALSLTVHNPNLFQAGMSISAGFCAPPPSVDGRRRSPKIFIQHGSADRMFPLERVGIPLQSKLKRSGYDVEFRVAKGQGHVPTGWQQEFLPAWLEMGGQTGTQESPVSRGTGSGTILPSILEKVQPHSNNVFERLAKDRRVMLARRHLYAPPEIRQHCVDAMA
mmetsp:Transcript_23681/g.28562  ORF Transcript_23681/g.28562 Transcript_23681/m.28562 type:complete len:307 (-) Transcript_23681:113-1033(-)